MTGTERTPYAERVDVKPIIAVSPNAFPAIDRHFYKFKPLEYGEGSMAEVVQASDGVPLMAYRAGLEEEGALRAHADEVMGHCHGLLLTGGTDISPGLYGEVAEDEAWAGDPIRDRWEIALYKAAIALKRPVLGVCRGMQLLNVAEGGSLWQDLVTGREGTEEHRSQDLYDALSHGLRVTEGSLVSELFEGETLEVNSVHHQGIKRLGGGLEALAWAPDGVVEAVARTGAPWVVGVQWHPEWLRDVAARRLFDAFVSEARRVVPS